MVGLAAQVCAEGYAVLEGVISADTAQKLRHLRDLLEADGTPLEHAAALRPRPAGRTEVHRNLIERAPAVLWPLVSHATVVDLMEDLMGPFVQVDSTVLVTMPPARAADERVVEWHRDRLGHVPYSYGYEPPLVVVTLAYLQDLSAEAGPLRILPGTHAHPAVLPVAQRHTVHPDERLLTPSVGDLVVLHHNLIHSGTRGCYERSFLGIA